MDVAALADTATAVSGMNSPTGFLSGAANLWNRVKTPEPVRDEMGRILLSQGQSGRQTIAQLDELMRQINESRMRQATGWGLLGGQQAAAPIAGLLVP